MRFRRDTSERNIPPAPALAWFLRDLIPDSLWQDFDLGLARSDAALELQARLHRHGGRDAWLRFIEETRRELPRMLDTPIEGIMRDAAPAYDPAQIPVTIYFSDRIELDVYASGRRIYPVIDIVIRAQFTQAEVPVANRHALFDTTLRLYHGEACLQQATGRYFLPCP